MCVSEKGLLAGTIGGGMTEGKVLEMAKETLADGKSRLLEADLRGKPGEIRDGICGGTMTLWISRLDVADGETVAAVVESLRRGKKVDLATRFDEKAVLEVGTGHNGAFHEVLKPDPHLLVVGAGHIGRCLAALMHSLEFQVSVQDEREDWRDPSAFPEDCRLEASMTDAAAALREWEGGRYAALVTRGFPQDMEALNVLSREPSLDYVGLLGSRKRVQTVLAARAASGAPAFAEGVLFAPVGMEIGAETPEEIAVSIAAQMIEVRRRGNRP